MPIHRHPALAPLSRDHHLALQLASALRKDGSPHLRARLPHGSAALSAHVRHVFEEELEPHFRVEERHLMVALDTLDPSLDALCAELRRQHDAMRRLVRDLATVTDDDAVAAILDRFGRLLESHVRTEERALFGRAQDVLGGHELDEIAPRLTRQMRVHEPSLPPAASRRLGSSVGG